MSGKKGNKKRISRVESEKIDRRTLETAMFGERSGTPANAPVKGNDGTPSSERSLSPEVSPNGKDSDDEYDDTEREIIKRYKSLGTELAGVGARLPNPLDYDIRKMMKVWNIQSSSSDDVLVGILARLASYKEIQSAVAVKNDDKAEPYLTYYQDDNQIPVLPPAGTDESTYTGKILLSSIEDLNKLDISISARFNDIFIAYEKSPLWIHCLTACFQTKALSDSSISNFFKSIDTACPDIRTLSSILKYVKGVLPIFMRYKDFRRIFKRIPFMVYHTSACSTPTILTNMIGDLGILAASFFTLSELEIIGAANNNYWDLQCAKMIPNHCVAMAHTYLAAMGKSLPNWYQGNKAANETSMGLKNKWTQLFLKFKEISHKNVDVSKVNSLKELADYIDEM